MTGPVLPVPRVLPGLERRLLRTLVGLPAAWAVRLAGGAPTRGDAGVLDPTVQLILALQRRRGMVGVTAGTAEATRRRMRQQTALAAGVPTPVGRVHHLRLPGADGTLSVRHYVPPETASGPRPLLVYLHGGGFVAGDLNTHDEPCRLLCRHAGVHVLAIDYRLAPEFPFPSGVEDAYAATQWAVANAAALGADPDRVAVGGDSAGANLATVACLLARRRGAPLPAAQLLIYPPTDHHTRWRSRQAFADGLLLTGEDIEFFHAQYAAGEDPNDERHSPLRSADLSGLPAAMVVTAAFDPLRDEGEAYAEALRAAGTRVVAWRVPGMVHGFVNLATLSRTAHDAVVEIAGALRALLATAEAPEPTGPPVLAAEREAA
jgi:acetyl esterase